MPSVTVIAELIGIIDMFCTPPATTTSLTPASTAWAAKCTACCDEPHWRSMVTPGTCSGSPAASHAVRAMSPACGPMVSRQPITTSSTAPGSMPVRSIRALSVMAPRSAGWICEQRPAPLADRRADGVDDEGLGHAVRLPARRPRPPIGKAARVHQASITEPIAAPADEVWEALADFGTWKWSGIEFESDGSGVGAVRRVPLSPGIEVVERCEALDDATRTVGYTILEGDPFPADDYHATMQIEPAGDDACELRWSSTYETGPLPTPRRTPSSDRFDRRAG